MIKCANCNKQKAEVDPAYGYTWCLPCQKKVKRSAGFFVEFTTDNIKDERVAWKRDVLQPFRDGVLSKEYLETYGTSGIEVTKQQVKEAKSTNQNEKGWWNYEKSKGGRNFKPKIKTID